MTAFPLTRTIVYLLCKIGLNAIVIISIKCYSQPFSSCHTHTQYKKQKMKNKLSRACQGKKIYLFWFQMYSKP